MTQSPQVGGVLSQSERLRLGNIERATEKRENKVMESQRQPESEQVGNKLLNHWKKKSHNLTNILCKNLTLNSATVLFILFLLPYFIHFYIIYLLMSYLNFLVNRCP